MAGPQRVLTALALILSLAACTPEAERVEAATEGMSAAAVDPGDLSWADVRQTMTVPPSPDSPRGRALAALSALEAADEVTLYSLQPWQPPDSDGPMPEYGAPDYASFLRERSAATERSQQEWCARAACLYGNRILGKVVPEDAGERALVLDAALRSLGADPDYAFACIAEYRHAVEFRAGGHLYQVLLCYGCGQVAVAIDGQLGRPGQTHDMGDEDGLDWMFVGAGVPLAE